MIFTSDITDSFHRISPTTTFAMNWKGKTEEEFWAWDGRGEAPTTSVNEVKDVPEAFKDWVRDNSERIERAEKRGTLPYFLRDNKNIISKIQTTKPVAVATGAAIGDKAISEALGIGKGEPMTFEEANMTRANPHYKEDAQYRVNCQSCVVANEMRRRGWDVEAYGNTKQINTSPNALSKRTNAAWVDKDGNIPTPALVARTVEDRYIDKRGKVRWKSDKAANTALTQRLEEAMSEQGRYHLSWGWTGHGNAGHIITAERLSGGSLRLYDPQTGELLRFLPIKEIKIDKWRGIHVLRVDNLSPNVDVLRGVVKPIGSKVPTPLMDKTQKEFWRKNGSGNVVLGDTDKHSSRNWNRAKNEIVKDKSRFLKREDTAFDNVQTGILRRKTDSRKQFIQHCYNKQELQAAEFIWNNPQLLRFKRVSKLGEGKDMKNPIDVANIAKKRARGVVRYNVYEFTYKGKIHLIKTEVYNNSEHLYSFTNK